MHLPSRAHSAVWWHLPSAPEPGFAVLHGALQIPTLSQTSLGPSPCALDRLTANALSGAMHLRPPGRRRPGCVCLRRGLPALQGRMPPGHPPGKDAPSPSTLLGAAGTRRGARPLLLDALAHGCEAKAVAYTVTTHTEELLLPTGLHSPRSRLRAVIKAY